MIAATVFAAVDFESLRGADESGDVPVQIGIARLEGGEIQSCLHSLLAPPVAIQPGPGGVHNITPDKLDAAPALLELWPEVERHCRGAWMVAHGAGTERRFLRAFPFHGFGPWVDTLGLARSLRPDLESHALGDVVAALGLEEPLRRTCPGLEWHDALFDACASLFVLREFIRWSGLESSPPEILLAPRQSAYHRRRRE